MILLFYLTVRVKACRGNGGAPGMEVAQYRRCCMSDDLAVIATLKSGELVSDELTYHVFERAVQDARDKNTRIHCRRFPAHERASSVA